MTRIVAGTAGGRRLVVPSGPTRPTSDRAREGLFSTVVALAGTLEGARVLDLYAGSGAVGLEAASRGAGRVLLVESAPAAVSAIRANISTLGLPGVEVLASPVQKALASTCPEPGFEVAFLDPPYAVGDADVCDVLADAMRGLWLSPGAILAVERPTRGGAFEWPAQYTPLRQRRYGEATIWYAEC